MCSSIKGKVKKKYFAVAGCFLAFQPARLSRDSSSFRPSSSVGCRVIAQRLGFSLPAVFIASWRRSLSVPKPTKQNVVKFGDHSSIWDSWPIAFSGYPRGPRVAWETGCPRHTAPNYTAETRSRTRVSREPDGHHQRNPQRWSGLDQRHSSCLWFQMLGVEAHSFLPHHQHDGGNLPGQG
jgi:hypothetical protein